MQLHGVRDELAKKNAHLVVIGNGQPPHVRMFRKATTFDGALYTDPELVTFKAATWNPGSIFTTFDPRTIWAAIKTLFKGFFQGSTQGDKFQLGGVLVVRPSGEVVYRYGSRYAGDHPSTAEILKAL